MSTRRVATAVGIAAGGALAAGFLATGIASAATPQFDVFGLAQTNPVTAPIQGVPWFGQTVTQSYDGLFNFDSTKMSPMFAEVLADHGVKFSATGQQVADTHFIVDNTGAWGWNNTMLTSAVTPYDIGDVASFRINEGSIFNITDFGGGFQNIYILLEGAGTGGTNEIHDYLVVPFIGGINMDWMLPLLGSSADITNWLPDMGV